MGQMGQMVSTSFVLRPKPPFRLDLTVWALRRRPDNAVDCWEGQTYRRVLVLPRRELTRSGSETPLVPVAVAVRQTGSRDDPWLEVTVRTAAVGTHALSVMQADVTAVLHRVLGLSVELARFYDLAADDAHLAPLAERFCGFKPPCFPTLFECLCNAIACQQITLTFGIRLLNRLAAAYGLPICGPPTADKAATDLSSTGTKSGPGDKATRTGDTGPAHAFPMPAELARADALSLRAIGFSQQKVRALLELAAVARGGMGSTDGQGEPAPSDQLESKRAALADLDDAAAVAWLRQFRGVGRWTAEYTLLRGLGRVHVFPGDDVGAREHLRRWLQLPWPLDYNGVRQVVAAWAPYAGLVYFSLLLDRLATQGYIAEDAKG